MSSIVPYFDQLSDQEAEAMYMAPAVVTVFVAGADHDIAKKETLQASKLVKYRTFTSELPLQEYYEVVEGRFQADLDQLLAQWTPESGQSELETKLAFIGGVLKHIPEAKAKLLRQSLRTLAEKVAEAQGGLVGFGSINPAERESLALTMLD